MKTSTQIWMDKRLIKPFVSATNFMVRLLGQVLRIDHSLEGPFKTIAICKYKGLGSIIQAIPLMEALKQKYPNAQLIFVTTKANKELVGHISLIDRCILLDDRSIWSVLTHYPRFVSQLISARIGVFIDLEIYSDFSSLTATLSMAKNRFGYYLKASHYRLGVYTHMMYFNTRVSIKQTYLQMGRLLQADESQSGAATLSFEKEHLIDSVVNKRYILINANASDLRIERRWGAENFIRLIEALHLNYADHSIVLIGSPSEKVYIDSICEKVAVPSLINLAGKTNLKELFAVIGTSELVITNDTGPMHIAAALRVPTVALFGPCSPDQYAVHDRVVAVYQNLYCSPCVHEFDVPPCHGDNQCMKQITLDAVMNAVVKALEGKMPNQERRVPFLGADGKVLGQVTRS